MKTYNREITKASHAIAQQIQKTDDDVMSKILIYNAVLKHLPRTMIVDADSMSAGVLYSGVTALFSEANRGYYVGDEIYKHQITFKFYPNDRAVITEGWYDREILFEGSWFEALAKILEMLSLTESGLTEKEAKAIDAFMMVQKI